MNADIVTYTTYMLKFTIIAVDKITPTFMFAFVF